MQVYNVAREVVINAIFITSLLLAAAYAKWYYWWRSWFGRSFMILVLALAGVRIQVIATELSLDNGNSTKLAIDWIGFSAYTASLCALVYLLVRIIKLNIAPTPRRHAMTAGRTQQYLEQTPGASKEEIKELIACWEQLADHHSDASVHPDQETPK